MTSKNTKNAMAKALLELMEEKDIDKITIKDIVSRSNITRQTFYYHFQDLMDLLEWTASERLEDVLHRCLEEPTMESAVNLIVKEVMKDRHLLNKLFLSKKRSEIERTFFYATERYFLKLADAAGWGRNLSRSETNLIIRFYSCGFAGIIFDVCNQKYPDTDEISRVLIKILKDDFVERPALI